MSEEQDRPRRTHFTQLPTEEVLAVLKRARETARRQLEARGETPPPEPVQQVCPICRNAGYTVRRYTDEHGVPASDLVPCDCPAAEEPRRRRRERLVRDLADTVLGKHPHVRFDNTALPFPNEEQRPYWHVARAWAEEPHGFLWMCGETTTGKTRLALCVANLWLDRGLELGWITSPDFFEHLRGTIRKPDAPPISEQLEAVQRTPYLVLDDLGQEQATEWARPLRFQLVNYRMERQMPTVITTNWQLSELKASPYTEERRLYYRARDPERCLIIPFENEPIEQEG